MGDAPSRGQFIYWSIASCPQLVHLAKDSPSLCMISTVGMASQMIIQRERDILDLHQLYHVINFFYRLLSRVFRASYDYGAIYYSCPG